METANKTLNDLAKANIKGFIYFEAGVEEGQIKPSVWFSPKTNSIELFNFRLALEALILSINKSLDKDGLLAKIEEGYRKQKNNATQPVKTE